MSVCLSVTVQYQNNSSYDRVVFALLVSGIIKVYADIRTGSSGWVGNFR